MLASLLTKTGSGNGPHPSRRRANSRRRPPTANDRELLRQHFGLNKYPDKMPYDAIHHNGLDLPDSMTSTEIRTIACACAGYPSAWHLGDLLVWLQCHPEAPESYDAIWAKLTSIPSATTHVHSYAEQTLRNYKTQSNIFPLSVRDPRLEWGHYEKVRDVPGDDERDMLLKQAIRDSLKVEDFRVLVNKYLAGSGERPRVELKMLLDDIKRLSREGQAEKAIALFREKAEPLIQKIAAMRKKRR